MVWSSNLQGRALTHLSLEQLPRQELQRAIHICFDMGVKWKEAPVLHLVFTKLPYFVVLLFRDFFFLVISPSIAFGKHPL